MRSPNTRLRGLLQEADWSGAALAAELNRIGVESGRLLRYDRSAVAHWLSGVRPRPPVAELVAEAFSRRLQRSVSVAETGLTDDDGPNTLRGQRSDAADELRMIPGRAHRRSLPDGAYTLAALEVPGWDTAVLPGRPPAPDTVRRVGRDEVAAARRMLDLCSRLDALSGGGAVRVALAQYLIWPVADWLRAPATSAVRNELLGVTAALSYLCAFVHFDDGDQARAQRYYTVSLRLAREAGDRRAYALALRGLSVQAAHLGHSSQALALAQAAVDCIGTRLPGHTRAFLHGQVAVAAAANGDRHRAASELETAQDALGRVQSTGEAVGVYHPGSLARQRAAVEMGNGLPDAAGAALRLSLRWRPAGEQRSRTLDFAELGALEFRRGRLEPACSAWTSFLDGYPRLDSARADHALRSLLSQTLPHRHNPQVTQLREHATVLAVQRQPSR